jgi:predicted PurR-regulated permease PerM
MKLARSMWVTKETAKSLQMAMDEMGASMQDIAWIPELRDQFFRLREEINRFSTPADADAQLKYIRSIGYDIQALMIRLKMLREWVTYYLIKYMKPFLDEFKGFIKWISDQLGGNMAQAAKKFAAVLGSIIGSVYSLFKLLSKIVPPVIDWIQALPENVKNWSAIFAAVGAAIMAGPFGIFLAAIGAAFVLLQDFVYYMNGWSSSNSMAPIWAALVRFSRGEGSQQVKRFEEFLKTVANLLDTIFKNIRKILIELDDFND